MGLATLGKDKVEGIKILKRHLLAFVRHMTLRKLLNFVKAEFNMMLGSARISSYPYLLKVESTNICNLGCKFCYDDRRPSREGERPYGRMAFEDFQKVVDELSPYLFKINLYGFGEPFLYPETFKMVKYASGKNIGVAISSNLNIEDDDLARKIVESGLEVLIFSCHGVSEASYRKFTRKGRAEVALGNIKRIIEERRRVGSRTPIIDWQYCVTRFNEGEIGIAKKMAAEIGVDQVRFIKPIIPANAEDEWHSTLFPRFDAASVKRPSRCGWLYRASYVNYDGGVLPCCREARLVENDFGNIRMEPFSSIWNNNRYQTSRRLIKCGKGASGDPDTICAQCPIFVP